MPARRSSLWCTAITGPSASTVRLLSVTMVAISMITSWSGFRPVISRSIQIRLLGFCMVGSSADGAQFNSRCVLDCAPFPSSGTPMAKRQLNRRQNWRIEKIQDERAARVAKRESRLREELEGDDLGGEQPGLVIAHFGVQVEIEDSEGELYRCHLRANLPTLVTGDRVVWRAGNQGHGVIVAQLPRDTELCRPDSRGQLKPVAANVDQIVIVFAPLPHPHANLIARYLSAAEHAGIRPLLLHSKPALLDADHAQHVESLLTPYRQLGYPVLEVSAHEGDGMTALQAALDNHVSVFVGQSGVGKSSLVNSLLPGVDIRAGALSELTGKGTHP